MCQLARDLWVRSERSVYIFFYCYMPRGGVQKICGTCRVVVHLECVVHAVGVVSFAAGYMDGRRPDPETIWAAFYCLVLICAGVMSKKANRPCRAGGPFVDGETLARGRTWECCHTCTARTPVHTVAPRTLYSPEQCIIFLKKCVLWFCHKYSKREKQNEKMRNDKVDWVPFLNKSKWTDMNAKRSKWLLIFAARNLCSCCQENIQNGVASEWESEKESSIQNVALYFPPGGLLFLSRVYTQWVSDWVKWILSQGTLNMYVFHEEEWCVSQEDVHLWVSEWV